VIYRNIFFEKSVVDFHKLVIEKEENRNIIIPHERRQIAYMKSNDGEMKKCEINEALDSGFKNASNQLYQHMCAWKEEQGKFPKKTEEIHNKVKLLGIKGYSIGSHKDEEEIKRRFKINNLAN
jgi:hypothetical protein